MPTLGKVTTDTSGTVDRDIAFHETPERTLLLDVYAPVESGLRPTAVLFHGGAFRTGSKTDLAEQARALAAEGYVVVTPEYRLSGEATFPAALIDAKAAIKWCRVEGEGDGIDPQRIAAVGYSAGANLATLASVTADEPGFEPEAYPGASSAVEAAVGWAGVYDFRFSTGEDPEIHVQYLGGTCEELPEAYDFASPMGQTDLATPPTLVVHGEADDVLPIEQARRYAESIDAVGTGAFLSLEAGSHQFPHESLEETITVTDRFLTEHLVGGDSGLGGGAVGAAGLDGEGPQQRESPGSLPDDLRDAGHRRNGPPDDR